MTTTTTIEKLGRLGDTATPDESGRLLLADAERGEPIALVSELEAEALADSLLGPPVDSHVSRAYRATPPAEGALVSVDGAGRYQVLGHELGGDAVVLCRPGQLSDRWTVYAWRVQVRS